MSIKLIIIGGVAGGATAAARARRLNEHAEIILFERDEHISFANCGLPYYIGEVIQQRDNLLVTTREAFQKRYRIDIRNFSEVVSIDRTNKRVEVRDSQSGKSYWESYDKIIMSPGAEPFKPPLEGIDLPNIFTLRNIPDTDQIKSFVDLNKPKSAVVVGGGFIGLEMAENLTHRGVKTTVIEMLDQVIVPLDKEMASIVQTHLMENGVDLELSNSVTSFSQSGNHILVSTSQNKTIECDLVILSIGVKPESALAQNADLALNDRGGIKVSDNLETNDTDIYAVGDAIETTNMVTKQPMMLPLAGPANKQGRVAADNAMGRQTRFNGVLGTSILKLFQFTAASTGLNEKTARQQGISYLKSYTHSFSHATYYPNAERMSIKILFSPDNGKLLGAQVIGKGGVDKRIDVFATAIYGKMSVYDLEALELAYAPPFSSAKDPVNVAGFVAANTLRGDLENIHWDEMADLNADNTVFVDLRTPLEIRTCGVIKEAVNIPVDDVREKLPTLDKSKIYILFCAVGLRGYIAYRIFKQHGFEARCFNGGYDIYKHSVSPGA